MVKFPDHPGLFNWHRKYAVQVGLPVAIVLALLLHAPFFVFFDVSYPPLSGFSPQNTRVVFVDGHTPEGARFLSWLEAEDPALFSAPFQDRRELFRPEPRGYRASFDMRTINLAKAPDRPLPTPAETVASMAPVFADLPAATGEAAPALPTTRIAYGGELAEAAPSGNPFPELPAEVSAPPRPTVFELGVGPEGTVRYLFKLTSSGLNTLDQEAAKLLKGTQFRKSEAPGIRWGETTVYWGSEPEPVQAP